MVATPELLVVPVPTTVEPFLMVTVAPEAGVPQHFRIVNVVGVHGPEQQAQPGWFFLRNAT
jgi:hypothetical protein